MYESIGCATFFSVKHGLMLLNVHRAARKRRTRPTRGQRRGTAFVHALGSCPLGDANDLRRWLVDGAEAAGRLLELVVRIFDDGR